MEVSLQVIQQRMRQKDWGYLLMLLWRTIFLTGMLFFSFIIGLVPQMMKAQALPLMVSGYIILALCALSVLKPMLLVFFIILSAPTSTMVKNIGQVAVGNTSMSASGLRWALITGVAFVINLYYFRNKGIQRRYWPYIVFLVYAVGGWIVHGSAGSGDKDIVWYALPLIIGMFSYNYFLRAPLQRINHADWMIRNSIFIVIGMFGFYFATGGLHMTANGPDGEIVARTVALFTSTILPVPLARWRYHTNPAQRRMGLFYVGLFLSAVGITLSRMALGTGMLLVVISMNRPRHIMRLVTGALIGGTLILILFTYVPQLRRRMFKAGRMPRDIPEFFETFDSSGRFTKLWPYTIKMGKEAPIFGQGPGTARKNLGAAMSAQKFMTEYPPHNEYIQVWHDFGTVGLIMMMYFYLSLVVSLWLRWKYHDDRGNSAQAYWSMAAFLSIFLVAFSAITANTLHYPFVMAMAFLILGMADALHDRFEEEHDQPLEEDVKTMTLPSGRQVPLTGGSDGAAPTKP